MSKIYHVRIAFNECKGCTRCAKACPRGVLAMGEKLNIMGFPVVKVIDDTRCIGCGICFRTCPEPSAITITREVDDV